MRKSSSCAWQLRTLLTLLTIVTSFGIGLGIPLTKFSAPSMLRNSLLTWKNKLSFNYLQAKTLNSQSSEAFEYLSVHLNSLQVEQERQLNFILPNHFQGKIIENVDLVNKEKVIALTFDDGPWPKSTNDVLYILKKHQIKATFFVVGRNVQNYPGLTQQIVKHGHALGNHSWNHFYHYHNPAAAAREIDNTAARVYHTTGVKMSLFRPPGGILNNGLAHHARKKKQLVVMWSADSQDYRVSSSQLVHNVLQLSKPGGIVLLHDGGGNRSKTVNSLPRIITELKNQGYKFVTIPELLEMKNQEIAAVSNQ